MTCALPDKVFHDRAITAYLTGWATGWTLPKKMAVWQWADKHRRLPQETSKEPGRWRTSRNPPARAIMESLSPYSGAEIVTVVAGVQTVKTESLNNLVGFVLDHDPAPMIVCQPTQELGNAWKLMRFDALVETTPSIAERITITQRRESSNTMNRVRFPGGWLIVSHAASAATLGMYSARYVMADEVDSYEELKGGEGDPLMTLRRRADSFGRQRKIYQCSSPKKIMGASLIWREYLAGDQREYWVPCPSCSTPQVLKMEQVLPSGQYLCEHCGAAIDHAKKTQMLEAGHWQARYPDRSTHHSYRLPSLYTPVGLGRTWKDLYDERVAAGDNPALVKAFVSTSLAIPYDPPGKIEEAEIRGLLEDWHMRQPPDGCLLLVAATDVQGNRLETQILGFGRGQRPRDPQIYVVDYHITIGSPTEPETWADLDDYLSTPIINRFGTHMLPRLHAVDSGNWAQDVYSAVAERAGKGWIAVKGASTGRAPLIGPAKAHEYNWRGRGMVRKGSHYIIGTNEAKDTLLDRLAIAPAQQKADRWWHLPRDLPDNWPAQMTAERRDPESKRWVPVRSGVRNEAIDVSVYAWAVAHASASIGIPTSRVIALKRWTARHWDELEERVCPHQMDMLAMPLAQHEEQMSEPPPQVKIDQPRGRPPPQRIARPNFVTRWNR